MTGHGVTPSSGTGDEARPDLADPRWQKLEQIVRRVFSVNDFHQSDMRTIAREAGMGFGTIYKNFGDKEGLLFAFVDHWQHAMERHLIDALGETGDPAERVRRMIQARLDYYEKNPDVARILFMTLPMKTWMEDPSFGQRELIHTELTIIHKAQKAGVLRDDLAATDLLDMMMGMIHRAVVMHAYRQTGTPLGQKADSLITLFLKGCSGKQP